MPSLRFVITPEAEVDLERLDAPTRKRVVEKLRWFVENFDGVAPIPLSGKWRGFFKLRVGDWRIVYEVDRSKNMIVVHMIDRRDKIYKRRK